LQKEHENVEYFIDSNIGGAIHGIPILHDISSIENIKEYYIIVGTFENTFLEIKNILIQNGLVEFVDFIWGDLYKRQVVVINANCHGDSLKYYLPQSRQFQNQYGIYPVKPIGLNEKGYIEDNVMAHADVFITQDIQVNNAFSYKLSYDYTIKQVGKGCKTICIPNMVSNGRGFFPTQTDELFKYRQYSNGDWNLFYRDTMIDEALAVNGKDSLEDVINYIQSREFDEKQVRRGFGEMMQKIRSREKMWDVKVADYIEKNYRTISMMVDASHPSDALMLEICRQVANILDINDIGDLDLKFHMGVESFIWPGVRKCLGIEYNPEYVRKGDSRNFGNENALSLKDYLQEYIWCLHDKFLE
jgi:hypothetical protein